MMKFNKITVVINNKIVATKTDSIWMTLSDTGVLYLYYGIGRIYFCIDHVNYTCRGSSITLLTYDKKRKLVSFRYQGPAVECCEANIRSGGIPMGPCECDDSDLETEIDVEYKIIFELEKNFNSVINVIDAFINK